MSVHELAPVRQLQQQLVEENSRLRIELEALQQWAHTESLNTQRLRALITEQRDTIVALNRVIGGEGSLTTDNLTTVERLRDGHIESERQLRKWQDRCAQFDELLRWIAKESQPRPSWEVIDRIDAALGATGSGDVNGR